jgi:hypothetical protein
MNYNKTKIYKIWSPKGDKIYIGSTCKEYLCQRMNTHRCDYKKYKKNNTKYTTSSFLLFDEYGLENCFIELIESKECNNNDERIQLEGHYIRLLKCVNKNIAGRTRKEYIEDNKETLKEVNKVYRENNKESINEKAKEFYLINKEKINEIHKQYREKNKEKKNNKSKEHYFINKDKINEKRREKVICECSSEFRLASKSRHIKTEKHQRFLMETIDT